MEVWTIGLGANLIIGFAYLAIAGMLARDLFRAGTGLKNPLAIATFLIFLTCGGGHFVHAYQLVAPSLGLDLISGRAARVEYGWAHMLTFDVTTAAIGTWYWTQRARFPALVEGTALYEDLRDRQRQALEIHDNIVQGVAQAKLALELDEDHLAGETVEDTLLASKRIIAELLHQEREEDIRSFLDNARGEGGGS